MQTKPRFTQPAVAQALQAHNGNPPPAAALLTPADVADRLGVTAKVLERWRGNGEGPAFVRLSSKTIRYRPEDIGAFVAGRTRASTAA